MGDFYPRPPRGGRRTGRKRKPAALQFLSTPSARRATRSSALNLSEMLFLSTPSARRATGVGRHSSLRKHISIHALREEGDLNGRHTPLLIMVFLSTPSARRATAATAERYGQRHISIHALREEGDLVAVLADAAHGISIHALREEGDSGRRRTRRRPDNFYPRPPRGGRLEGQIGLFDTMNFYPRPPRGGRHSRQRYSRLCRHISIHALREEGDRCPRL